MSIGTPLGDVGISVVGDHPSTTGVLHHRLEAMIGGWVVGDFEPAALRCRGAEVAVKHISRGTREARHEHRIATEVNVVVSGVVMIAGRRWHAGDVVVVLPHTASAFEALSDAVLVVVKSPSVVGDKHLVQSSPGTWCTAGTA